MRATECEHFSNISATPASFTLDGGYFQLSCTATFGGGSVVIQVLGPDGSTYLNSHTALTGAGIVNFYAPPGTYRLLITTATAVYASITRIPGE